MRKAKVSSDHARARLERLLDHVRSGRVSVGEAADRLASVSAYGEDLEFARVDHHRALRRGHPEVIFGEPKTAAQIVAVARAILAAGSNVLVTRLDSRKARAVGRAIRGFRYHPEARLGICVRHPAPDAGRAKGTVAVVAAGTSDLPVAEEAALTAEAFGHRVDRIYDVGVAGLGRLLGAEARLKAARVLVVVAGMEGALPSVVAGLVDKPVVAVPTSVGYGAAFGGIAALLGMLTACAPGVAVVNIDNGFGAGYLAAQINRLP
ncbi:MAG TPA: nickel pincer cofactor biosynthesis protein LarB [Thermodesulfobacteriota bacterium]